MTLPLDWSSRLEKEIRDSFSESLPVDLGFRHMPDGYVCMWSGITEHYYWLRWDGAESEINCDKWAVYRSAKMDSLKFGPAPTFY